MKGGCEFDERDERYKSASIDYETNELAMMGEYNLDSVLMQQPSFFQYSAYDSIKDHKLSLWHRPTIPWKLECDQRGDTRFDALEKTQIQINISGVEKTAGRTGLAITVLFSIIAIVTCCCGCCMCNESELFMTFVALSMLLQRFLWIILGSIIIAMMNTIGDTLDENSGITTEFSVINECADEYSIVDTQGLVLAQEDEYKKVEKVSNISWAVFIMFFIELAVLIIFMC